MYDAWRAAVARRSAAGELRANAEEREALQRLSDAIEQHDAGQRAAWEAERAAIDTSAEDCACGHPFTHHDGSGSCFHVVGCATGCGCGDGLQPVGPDRTG